MKRLFSLTRALVARKRKIFALFFALAASIGMSFAQNPGIVSSGTKGGMSYTFYDNGLLEISGSGALPGSAFTNWDGGFGTSVKNIRFAEDCEVYGLDYLWFACYTENSQLETVEINSVTPIMFSGTSGAGIFYRQDGAVTLTITAPGIVDVENRIIDTYGSPVNMIFNMPATTVFEKKWFSGLENYFAVTIPTGATGHIPAGYVFKDSYDQEEYDHLVADGYEDIFWDTHSNLVEGEDYTLGVESTFVITAENASQIFGKATVSFQAPTEASNSEWVLWRKSDLKTFPDMSPGDQKVCKDVTVKVNNGVYNTDSGFGVHFESLGEDGVQFVAPEGKVFKRIVILNEYGTFSDPNWSYDKNYKRWSGSADTVGFVGNICGISLIEFEVEASAPATPAYEMVMNLINAIGTVELTAECKAKIDAARAAFIALSDGDKAQVTNYETLTTAEAAFDNVMDIWLSGDCDVILWKDTTLSVRKHAGEGSGAMADYNYASRAPWYSGHWTNPQPNDIVIKSVKIEEGVTHLGDFAFAWMSEMKTVTIPSSVITIPANAFYWSKAVDDIYLYNTNPSDLMWIQPNTADVQFKPEKGTRCHVPADLLTAYQEKFGTLNMTFVGDLDPITPLTPEQQQALDAAKDKIAAIPSPVVYTPACKDAIDAARAAYDALTPDMLKQLVSNYATLTAAEATYDNMKYVSAAEAKINEIPSPMTAENTKLSVYNKVQDARAAYDALTADQKALVSNYSRLTAAEAAFAAIGGGGGSAPDGALNGKFTVNAGGDQIVFSKGNLQYQASTTTFRFATNQYDMIGADNANISDTYTGWIDLFGWGTGNRPAYASTVDEDYSTFTDWGTNAISNGGNEANLWRTMTVQEWNNLIRNRTNAAHLQGQATVADVHGYVLLPDSWTLPAGLSFTASPKNWTTNVYTAEQWAQMEAAGAVFLPATGHRDPEIKGVGEKGWYWSSDVLSDIVAYDFEFNDTISRVFGSRHYFGQPVRLVAVAAGASPLADAQAAKDLIDAIGEVSYPDSKEAIKAAREAVDALGANASLLDEADLQKLTDAEAAYAQLLAEAVAAVKDQIDALPDTPLTDATKKLSEYNKVTDAREAYDALSDEEKTAVDNYDKLEAAEAAFAAIGGGTGLNVSTEDIGKVLCADGSLYATKDEATAASKTPVAMIAYVEDSKGLAIALEDESNTMIWSTAITTAAAHTPAVTGGTWKLPSLLEWQQMFVGCGADLTPSETSGNVTDYTGLRDKLLAAGGKGFVEWSYWTTTEWADKPEEAWDPYFSFSPEIVKWYTNNKKDRDDFYVRAILAFNVVASNDLADAQAAKDLIDAIPQPVVLSDDCNAAIQAARDAVTALGENASLLDDADIDKLAKAEADFALLIKDATAVADLIDAIGEVTFSADSKGKIADAREAYEALDDELKPYVSNLATLTAAEEAYEAARPFAPVTTVPAAVEALQYTGAAQTLITAGAAEHGTVLYSLDGENYSTELPTALLPGAYTIYYKVQATDDYKDVAPVTVIATIAYNYPATYSLFGIPEGWSVKVNDEEVAVVNGAVKNIAANDRFDIMPVKPEDVKLVEVVPYLLDLATVTDSVIYILDGDSITGTANGPITVVIVPDAKVYFKDVNLTNTGSHPAVLCGGNAEIVVVGENHITCTKEGEYGIRAAGAGTTLTVSGDKTLLKATIDPNGGTVNQ